MSAKKSAPSPKNETKQTENSTGSANRFEIAANIFGSWMGRLNPTAPQNAIQVLSQAALVATDIFLQEAEIFVQPAVLTKEEVEAEKKRTARLDNLRKGRETAAANRAAKKADNPALDPGFAAYEERMRKQHVPTPKVKE